MELSGKRVLVVGLGRSGVAAALFLRSKGAKVMVSDSKPHGELSAHIPELLELGVRVETGMHGERTFRDQDLIVVSPGVPMDVPQLQQARALGVPIIGEIELASRFLQGPVVAITGSNGKTTTTSLVGEIILRGGFSALVGGNIGTPVIELLPQSSPMTYHVLEASSFQLETIETFRPHIAVLLNITPDHLDRHRTFPSYVAAKARIFENQAASDFAVLNADDENCVRLASTIKARVIWFSTRKEVEAGAYIKEECIFVRMPDDLVAGSSPQKRGNAHKDAHLAERLVMPVDDIPLKGEHNLQNVLAGVCVGAIVGCSVQKIRGAVAQFKAVEHRLQLLGTIHGVEYYNDSKATNVDATIKALESFPGNIHLILGGKDKGSDYTALLPLIKERVKRVYTIGSAAEKISAQIGGAVELVCSGTLHNAVRTAAETALPGDIVLLSPACASFDQFDNYEHRGRVFKELVQAQAARPVAGSTSLPLGRRANG